MRRRIDQGTRAAADKAVAERFAEIGSAFVAIGTALNAGMTRAINDLAAAEQAHMRLAATAGPGPTYDAAVAEVAHREHVAAELARTTPRPMPSRAAIIDSVTRDVAAGIIP